MFDPNQTFYSERIVSGYPFPSTEVTYLQGVRVDVPQPEDVRIVCINTEFFEFSHNDVLVAGCTFLPRDIDTPNGQVFARQRGELVRELLEGGYGELIINAVAVDPSTVYFASEPVITQNTPRSFLVMSDLIAAPEAAEGAEGEAAAGEARHFDVVHGYIRLSRSSMQYIAVCYRDTYRLSGAEVFVTWLNKLLEMNA